MTTHTTHPLGNTPAQVEVNASSHEVTLPAPLAMIASVSTNKLQLVIWCVLMALGLGLSMRDYDAFQLGTYRDDAAYVILAQSLAHGEHYGLINEPGAPGTAIFPIGYPLLLAPFVLAFPDSPAAMRWLSLLATFVNAGLVFWGWNRLSPNLSRWWSLPVVGLVMVSPLIVDHTRMVMSEPIFTTFCLLAMLITERVARGPRSLPWLVVLGILLVVAPLVRTIGVVLVGLACVYVLCWRKRAAILELGVVAGVMALVLGGLILGTSAEIQDVIPLGYLSQSAAPTESTQSAPGTYIEVKQISLPERVVRTMISYAEFAIRKAIFPPGGGLNGYLFFERAGIPNIRQLLGYAIGVTLLIGYVRWLVASRRPGLFALFLPAYLGVIFLWPYPSDRLLYPVYPQLYLAVLLGCVDILLWVVSRLRIRHSSSVLASVSTAIVTVVLGTAAVYTTLRIDASRAHAGDLECRASWLRENTDNSAVILTEEPQIDYLYGKRKTVPYPRLISGTELPDTLSKKPYDYILVAPEVGWPMAFRPTYTEVGERMYGRLTQLEAKGQIRLVYSGGCGSVRVYEPTTQAGRSIDNVAEPNNGSEF